VKQVDRWLLNLDNRWLLSLCTVDLPCLTSLHHPTRANCDSALSTGSLSSRLECTAERLLHGLRALVLRDVEQCDVAFVVLHFQLAARFNSGIIAVACSRNGVVLLYARLAVDAAGLLGMHSSSIKFILNHNLKIKLKIK
jgi:hypothetical protein